MPIFDFEITCRNVWKSKLCSHKSAVNDGNSVRIDLWNCRKGKARGAQRTHVFM